MKKYLLILLVIICSSAVQAQLSGIKTVGAGKDYATLTAAITALNAGGSVGPGGVTFNVDADYTESTTAQLAITITGTAGNEIIFQKSGVGANPKITRTDAGSNSTSTFGGLGDGVIRLDGTDYITFDGIDVAASASTIEYGYYLHKPTATNGCQQVTIKNSAVTMTKGTSAYVVGIYVGNGASTVSSATGVTVSANSGRNENITITGNTISNVHAGIVCRGYSTAAYYDQNIVIGASGAGNGNTIQNFGGGSATTTYGVYFIYTNNTSVEYNTINNAGGGGSAHASTFYGVFFSTVTGSVACNNNAFTLNTSGTSGVNGIYQANGTNVTTQDYNNNTFSGSTATTGTVYLIYASNTTANAKNIIGNSISGSFTKTGASGTFYCFYDFGSPTGIMTFSDNNFSNITAGSGSSSFYGMYSSTTAGQTQNVYNNTFSNITTGTGTLYGMYVSSADTRRIYGNTISSLAGAGTVYGLYVGSGGNTLNDFYKNKVFDLSSSSTVTTAGLVTGIYFSTLGTAVTGNNVYNNIIGNLTATAATGTDAVRGIAFTSATATSAINVYYNTIYLTGAGGTNFGSSGIYHTASATATSGSLSLKNNIIVNNSTANGTGLTVAYRRSTTNLGNFATTSNNNLLYAGAPSATNLIFSENPTTPANSMQTIAAYKIYVAGGRETASVSEDPQFVSTNGADPDFLKFDVSSAHQCESGAANIATYTTDFFGTIRAGNGGYVGTGTAPDMGAWELEGIAADLTAPSILYTNLSNTLCTTDRSLTATISDGSGVNTTSLTKPRLYFKKSTETNQIIGNTSADDGWKWVEATNAASPFNFNFNTALLTSAVVGGDVIQYFVVAQDVVTIPNVGIYNGTLATTPTSVALDNSAAPITGFSSYTVSTGGLSGTVNVGPGETYTTFSAAGGLFSAINAAGLDNNLTAVVTGNITTENGTVALNQISYGCATYTLTIKPSTTQTISGSVSSGAILKLNGADNVIIDGSNSGGTDRSLTIINTATTAPTAIAVVSLGVGLGATNNTIKNCTISTGVQTTLGYGISVGGATPGTTGADNDDITIQNNNITNSAVGIYASGTTAISAGGNDNLNIIGNTINYTGTVSTPVGIRAAYALSSLVSQNNVSVETTAGTTPVGISLETGFVSSSVTGNKISKVLTTSTSGYGGRGITVGTGTATSAVTIANNVIYGVNGSNYTGFTNSSSMGICIGTVGGSTTLTTTTGGVNVYFNSVNMYGDYSYSGACLTAALYVGSGASALDIRNNVLVNSLNNTTNATSKNYAIYSAVANTAFTTIDYNDYYVSGSQGMLGFLSSDRVDLAAIQTGFAGNASSIVADPIFNSATNLVPNSGSPLLAVADNSTGITDDYLNNARGGAPTIGAYENTGDFAVPVITLGALGNTNLVTNRTTLNFATITDASDVNVTAGTNPRLYYKKSTAANAFVGNTNADNGWKYVEANNAASPFDFTIDYSKLVGGSVVSGDVIQYFVVAQDLAGSPNVGISSNLSFVGGTPATVDLQGQGVTSITGTASSYLITGSISGTITVPGTYASLTLAGGAFEAINNATVTGNIEIQITGDLTSETGLNALNEFQSPYTLKIYPTGAIRSISGTSTAALIKLNAADNVTIDGSIGGVGTDKSLTISNTNTATTSAVIWLASNTSPNGATNNTIKNCIITGNAPTTTFGGVISSGSTMGAAAEAANSNNTYQNNTVNTCNYGIAIVGPTGNETGTVITNNLIGSAIAGNKIGLKGIAIYQQSGVTVSSNTILGVTTATTSTSNGIYVGGTQDGGSITKNNISDIKNTNSTGYGTSGIGLYSSSTSNNVTLDNNVIYDVAAYGYGSLWGQGDNGYGIMINTGGGYNIYYNSINLATNQTVAANSAAINIASAATALDIRNNIFVNAQTTGTRYAIYTAGTNTAFTTINNNNYFSAANTVGYLSSDRATLANWQTATGQDVNSFAQNPNFTTSTNLVPVVNAFPSNYLLGVQIAGISTDYAGTTRSNPSDLGAYEGVDANRWIGGTSTAWATSSNWDDNSVAASNQNVTVAKYATNSPILGADVIVNSIALNGTNTLGINGNTLTINGAVSGTGTLSGSPTSNLTVGGAAGTLNFTSGTRTLKDLTVNSAATATLGTTLDIVAGASSGTVSVANGAILTTGSNLTLKSDASGTARVGNSAGTITGNVTTETFIPGGRRAYRFLGNPFTTAQAMSSLIDDIYVTGDGTVAGTGGATPGAGLDATGSNAASSYWFDNTTNGWKAFMTATDASWTQYAGTRVLVRGDRTQPENLTASPSAPNSVTLDMTGVVNTGDQNIVLATAGNYHLVSNPYPSPTDIGTVVDATTNIGTMYWVWDANAVTKGAYVPKTVGSGAYNLAMNGAFFVQPTVGTTLAFTEANKTATATANLYRTATASNQLEVQVNYNSGYADLLFVRNNATASTTKEATDGSKLSNPDVNIYAIASGNDQLTLDSRPIANNTIIPVGFTSTIQSNFEIALNSNTLNNGLDVIVKDKFLNVEHTLTASNPYSFAVTADVASQGENRFELVFRTSNALPSNFVTVSAVQQGNAIAVNFITVNEQNMSSYEVEESANGNSFTKSTSIKANNTTTANYNWLDATINNGNNYYRIKAIEKNGVVKYSQVVNVRTGTKGAEFTVYPNPVKGGTVNVQLMNVEQGLYSIKIVNKLGQEIASRMITHNGGSATQSINIGNVASGTYNMVISNGTTSVTKTVIVE